MNQLTKSSKMPVTAKSATTGYGLFNIAYSLRSQVQLFQEVGEKDAWGWICANPDAIEEIRQRYEEGGEMSWKHVCKNPAAFDIIKEQFKTPKKMHNVSWKHICENVNPQVLKLVKIELERLKKSNVPHRYADVMSEKCWDALSANPAAMDILEQYPEYVNQYKICANPSAIVILTREWKHPTGKIPRWELLCANPAGMDIIVEMFEKKPFDINWDYLVANPSARELILCQIELDKERIAKGLLPLVNRDFLHENVAMLDVIKQDAMKDINSVYWNRVCEYNFDNGFKSQTYPCQKHDYLTILKRYASRMEASSVEHEKQRYQRLVLFETEIHRPICRGYRIRDNSSGEFVRKKIEENPEEACKILRSKMTGQILEDILMEFQNAPAAERDAAIAVDNPAEIYFRLNRQRNKLAHEAQRWDGESSGDCKLDEFRKLKHIEYIKYVVMSRFKSLRTFDNNNAVRAHLKSNADQFKDLVDSREDLWLLRKRCPIDAFNSLLDARNKIAHQDNEDNSSYRESISSSGSDRSLRSPLPSRLNWRGSYSPTSSESSQWSSGSDVSDNGPPKLRRHVSDTPSRYSSNARSSRPRALSELVESSSSSGNWRSRSSSEQFKYPESRRRDNNRSPSYKSSEGSWRYKSGPTTPEEPQWSNSPMLHRSKTFSPKIYETAPETGCWRVASR